MRILDPEGRQIRSVDGPARGPELFWFEAEDAGRYRIQVIPFEEETGTFAISLERLDYTTPEETWSLSEGGRLAYTDGQVVAESVEIVQNGQILRVDGTLGLDPDAPSDMTFVAENVALKDVARLTGQPPGDWEGRADLRGRLTGTRRNPRIELEGEVSEGMIRGFRFVRVVGEVEYDDYVADVDLRVVTPEEGHELVLVTAVDNQAVLPMVLAAGLRRTRYPEVTVERLALAVEQYVGDWRLGYTFNRTDVDGERVNGHDAAIDRYYGERDVIGLRLTAGSEDVLQGTQVVASQVRALALQGRHGLSDAWALQWGLGYVRQGDFHDRRWLQLGLRRAF